MEAGAPCWAAAMTAAKNVEAVQATIKVEITKRGRGQSIGMDTTMPHWPGLVDGCFQRIGCERRSVRQVIPAIGDDGQVDREGRAWRVATCFAIANKNFAALPVDDLLGNP